MVLEPATEDWIALGTRHDRGDMYGMKPLEKVLSNVDVNIMLILFPLDVSPMGPIDGDPHRLRPERDYPVWRHKLPEGSITLDEIGIEFGGINGLSGRPGGRLYDGGARRPESSFLNACGLQDRARIDGQTLRGGLIALLLGFSLLLLHVSDVVSHDGCGRTRGCRHGPEYS